MIRIKHQYLPLTLAVAVFGCCTILFVGRKFVAAIDNLSNNLANLSTHVDALIAQGAGGGANETAIQQAADQVAALDQKVVAATPQTPTP